SFNTGIGYKTEIGSGGLNNATAIGTLAKVDCSNCMVLGSVNGVNGASSNVSIGIGTTNPHPSAALDIVGPDRGLLIPRVALTAIDDITTIPSPATSLIVYNTVSAGAGSTAVAPGFYYWNETSWAQLSANGNHPAGTV